MILEEPLVTLGLATAAVAVPVALLERRALPGTPARAALERGVRVVIGAALGWALVAAVIFLITARATVGSNDFFFYVCAARDRARGLPLADAGRYTYFPGVYAFWGVVLRLTGGGLGAAQGAFVLALGVDLVLVAAVVFRATRRLAAAGFAAAWGLVLLSFMDGFEGTTEPIATIPVLAALLAWGGEPLRGRRGAALAVAIGVGLGLAVYMKQGTGLLALGGLAWLPSLFLAPREKSHHLGCLVLTAVTAAVVLLVGILAEGDGLAPLTQGVESVGIYVPHESFAANLERVVLGARPIAFAFGLATVVALAFAGLAAHPRGRALLGDRAIALSSFAVTASLVTLSLLAKRPYYHYLLPTACLIPIAVVLAASELGRRVPQKVRSSPAAWLVLAGTAGLLLTHPLRHQLHFKVWPLHVPDAHEDAPGVPRRWHQQAPIAADLADMKALVTPGEELLVLPPQRNAVHFLLGTRTSAAYRTGYGWGRLPGVSLATLDWARIPAVVTTSPIDTTGELEAFWRPFQTEEFCQGGFSGPLRLSELGYEPTRLRVLVLWRRKKP